MIYNRPARNLEVIVTKLLATDAKLIFATTTPYDDVLDNQIRSPKMPEQYNKVALEVMQRNGIAINDFYK